MAITNSKSKGETTMEMKNISEQSERGDMEKAVRMIELTESGELTPSQLQGIDGGWINPLYHSSEGFWSAVYGGAVIAYARNS
jgi:hypothetical protein